MALKLTINELKQDVTSEPSPHKIYGEVVAIKISDIDTSDRLRPIDSDYVTAIAASIQKEGLLNPIDICQLPNQKSGLPYRLVAGGHRLAAYVELGYEIIPAFIRSNDADKRRAREIAENIFKTDLKPIERATFVSELVNIEKRRSGLNPDDDGRKASANARWKTDNREFKNHVADANETISFAFGFTDRVAEKLGVTTRTIQNDLALLRIPPSILNTLAGNDILENATALKRLAKMPDEHRQQFAKLIKNGVDYKAAFDQVIGKKEAHTDTQKNEKSFYGAYHKMTPTEREGALRHLVQVYGLPKGITINFAGVVNE